MSVVWLLEMFLFQASARPQSCPSLPHTSPCSPLLALFASAHPTKPQRCEEVGDDQYDLSVQCQSYVLVTLVPAHTLLFPSQTHHIGLPVGSVLLFLFQVYSEP
uniref:Secreted protein n=1 Tax=Opuntia streptacantha TaxID=393608 RepID=A0A7C8Z0Q4_OPUST